MTSHVQASPHASMVIVGGGECGARAAFSLRRFGWSGTVTVLGAETLPAYERPPLSKGALQEPDWNLTHPYSVADYAEAGIDLRVGTQVGAIEPDRRQVRLDTGEALPYHKLLLATGSRPRPLAANVGGPLLYLRDHEDARRLRAALRPGRSIAVVGAGFVGLEVAASARTIGCAVVVIEAGNRALMRSVPADVACSIVEAHQERGVRFEWNASLTSVRSVQQDLVKIVLSTGMQFDVDAVLVGIGAEPVADLAADAGLAIDNGIACDDHLRTSDKHIYAAGDCASFPHRLFDRDRVRLESWHSAHAQGESAAANMVGLDTVHMPVPAFWSDQFDRTMRQVGLSSYACATVVRDGQGGGSMHFGLDTAGRVVCASAFDKDERIALETLVATKLIERRTRPSLAALADGSIPLKRLLKTSEGI